MRATMTTIREILKDEQSRALLQERLAALCHEQWSGWMRFLFTQGKKNSDGSFTIWDTKTTRWERQMMSSYDELPGIEQLSDQAEAERILAVLDEVTEATIDRNAEL
jgi:hypothetical protein